MLRNNKFVVKKYVFSPILFSYSIPSLDFYPPHLYRDMILNCSSFVYSSEKFIFTEHTEMC